MRINYDKIQSSLKSLGRITENEAFLEGFLSAFNFPEATYSRLRRGASNDLSQGLRIRGNGGLYFLTSTLESLNAEFNTFKKNNDLDRVREQFILIFNETDILAYNSENEDVLETSKEDLYRHIEFFNPLLGIKQKFVPEGPESANRKAVEKFAELYNELRLRNPSNSDDISPLLCRILFCCFVESIGILTSNGLQYIMDSFTDVSGSDTSKFLNDLFDAIKSDSRDGLPGYFSNVRYIDDRLFLNPLPPLNFSQKARNIILDLLGLDWSSISPDMLGSLIQLITRDEAVHFCGNYTSTTNINKVIGPLFMDELYREFEKIKTNGNACKKLLRHIKSLKVLDPACGTGNFLLVAFRELNKLAGKIRKAIDNTASSTSNFFMASQVAEKESGYDERLFVPWSNFFGIDNDEFSCTIARLGFLFVVCQEAQGGAGDIHGTFIDTLDVLFSGNIIVGNATRMNWEEVCGGGEIYLIGNPPYVGSRRQTPEQKSDLEYVFAGYNSFSNLDYAACWFMIATRYISVNGGRFAFVTTNSLTQGEQVQLLWPKLFEKGVHIRFAHTSFKWENDARNQTAVTVVVIGVVQNTDIQKRELFTKNTVFELRGIGPYLTPNETIVQKRRSPISNLPRMVKGNMPLYWSDFLLTHQEVSELLVLEPRAGKFLKRVMGADEFINGIERWCFWIHDEHLNEANDIPYIADKIKRVRQKRLASKDASARNHAAYPHRFRENRETTSSSLVIPSVSSENRVYIPIGFVDNSVIVTNLAFVIYDCEPWIFGVVASKMHDVWIRTVCGALETRIRYSSQLGYNTFPFPVITMEQKAKITERVFAVIAAREMYPEMTYADWYNPRSIPEELHYAHYLLDTVIDRCYRNEPFVSDLDRLNHLFELYNELKG